MSQGRLDELGTGKPKIPAWLWAVGLIVPTAAVLAWLYWAELSDAVGPTLIPIVSPVIPKPDGAPRTAHAVYDSELGVRWLDCREGGGGHVSAEWWPKAGFHRAWIVAEGGCARPAGDRTPGALRLPERGAPALVLARGTASNDAGKRRAACDAAHAEGLDGHARVAGAVAAGEAGSTLKGLLATFAKNEPRYLSARPGGSVETSQLCNFRFDPPPKPGEVGSVLGVDVSYGQDRP